MTIWNYITRFMCCLSSEEMQKAITSLNKPVKHQFWIKLEEALWTLVKEPKEINRLDFKSQYGVPSISTPDSLEDMAIEIPPDLKKKFALDQPGTQHGTDYIRFKYDSGDLSILGNITRLFSDQTDTLFNYANNSNIAIYPLRLISHFMSDADERKPNSAICEPNAENIFLVHGSKGPIMVSVRKKLNTWRMKEVKAGDYFRCTDAYVFI